MHTVSFTAFRNKITQTVSKVNADHEPVIIKRRDGQAAVLISLKHFQSYEATAYLIASPNNAERLNLAIKSVDAGIQVNETGAQDRQPLLTPPLPELRKELRQSAKQARRLALAYGIRLKKPAKR